MSVFRNLITTITILLFCTPSICQKKSFTKKEIADTKTVQECTICLSAENKEEVDKIVGLALEAGGTTPGEAQDQGFMYQHSYNDLDGHLWEIVWMDPAAIPPSE